MSNERPDNEISWGNKLDDPDGVSPEPWAGKDAAWEKLYSRLHEKPRRRIPFWYWAAAACLLGALYLGIKPGDLRRGSPGVVPAEKRTEGAGEQEATGRVTGERRGAGRAAAGAGRVVAGAETGASVILNKRPAATFRKIGQSVAKRPVTTGQPVA